jgi:protein-tyrosine phosphatase
VPRPRGGDWLPDEIEGWRRAGIAVVVSALEPEEEETFDLSREAALCCEQGVECIAFPIVDRGVPASVRPFDELIQRLDAFLHAGKNVAIHCRQSIGRAGMLTAGLLIHAGQTAERAMAAVSAARGTPVPETLEQRQWLERFARQHGAAWEASNHVRRRRSDVPGVCHARTAAVGDDSRRGARVSSGP